MSPTPCDTEAISDPIEVYDMFIVEDEESKDSIKQNAKFHRRLIRHVRRHRVLYDPKHKQFSCAEAKNEVWEKIAKRMGADGTYTYIYTHTYIMRESNNLTSANLIYACEFVFQLIYARMLG